MSISRDRQAVGVAKEIWFANDKMYVRLADGREIGVPVAWFPKLKEATPEQRRNWRLIGGGIGIYWEDIDEDIAVESLIWPQGFPLEYH
ncbi:MAG: DUF2442 domain-containing protein [Clostridia bacterium]|nr:MAG: DUF2442 domain-containing protein [Clostridia bacterium]